MPSQNHIQALSSPIYCFIILKAEDKTRQGASPAHVSPSTHGYPGLLMGLKIKPLPGPQTQAPKIDPSFCKLIPRPSDGPKNQALSMASKSTHSGALQSTFRCLQMDLSLVPENRPPGAFKCTLLWCLCKLIPRPTDGPENQILSKASKSTHSGALKSTFRGLQMDLSLAP